MTTYNLKCQFYVLYFGVQFVNYAPCTNYKIDNIVLEVVVRRFRAAVMGLRFTASHKKISTEHN